MQSEKVKHTRISPEKHTPFFVLFSRKAGTDYFAFKGVANFSSDALIRIMRFSFTPGVELHDFSQTGQEYASKSIRRQTRGRS